MIELTEKDHLLMLQLAKKSIEHGFKHGSSCAVNPGKIPRHLHAGVRLFVSISNENKANIGCVGNLDPSPIFVAVRNSAYNSAFKDNRFTSITRYNINRANLKIHYLTKGLIYHNVNKKRALELLQPHHSLIISYNGIRTAMVSDMQKVWGREKYIDEILHKSKSQIGKEVPLELFSVDFVNTFTSPEVKYSEIGPMEL
jgi:AMMECR1 domain-containing protein